MTTELTNAYKSGVLIPEIHSRFVMNLESYARRANIPQSMILNKMSKFDCTPKEIAYVKAIRRQSEAGIHGLVYHGKETASVLTRMMGVAGCCLRNFVEAKLMTLQELLADIKEGQGPTATVLLIPNFFVNRSDGGKIADWNIAELLALLYDRMASGKQTFLYVSDMDSLRKSYGDPIADHVEKYYRSVPA